ncbi:MAG: carboxylating nicotinate-nucleotide diphosphorylase [Desulfovibrio sp.]
MSDSRFDDFFQAETRMFLLATLRIAVSEDGPDLTSRGIFEENDMAQAHIVAKESTIVAGLPLIPLILEFCGEKTSYILNVDEGDRVSEGAIVAILQGPATELLKAERVILNYIGHLSGIAELTSKYVAAVEETETTILDTRKTLPGLRYPEKYAVVVGGGKNHRKNLAEMLLVKDNHIDRAGSISSAIGKLRGAYDPCPPIEVECRNMEEVSEAVQCGVDRIMLDNMSAPQAVEALEVIPTEIETEISGNVSLENLKELASLGADYISVGRLTHSAKNSDFSMRISTI